MPTIIVTNAPEAYDYRYCVPVLPTGVIRWHGRPVRLVRVDDPNDAAYITARYQSGNYVAVPTENLEEDSMDEDPAFTGKVIWPEC